MEIDDISRFETSRKLMAWLGLVPSENSAGGSARLGRIAQTGNTLARTMIVEAIWSYRDPAREQHKYLKRSAHLPDDVRENGSKVQVRLTTHDRIYYRG